MKKLFLISLFVLFALTTGCSSGSSSSSTPSGSGDGNYVSDDALDSSITVPAGVSVTGLDGDLGMETLSPAEIVAYSGCLNTCAINTALTNEERMNCIMGCLDLTGLTDSSGAFSVAINIANSGSSTETVTIQAGTVLTPASSDYQPMMLIQDIDLTITPGDTEEFLLPVYCLAPSLNAPDGTNSYTISDITNDACLLNILDILSTKDVDSFTFSDSSVVQDSIWNCIEGDYDPAVDTPALYALP